jgi:hypothetical protein
MRARRGKVTATIAACLAAFLVAASLSSRLRSYVSSVSNGGSTAAFVFLVGPNSEESNRTRDLTFALHSLFYNYLAEFPAPVVLFFADDVPPEQYSPATLAAIVPQAMARLVEVTIRGPMAAMAHARCARAPTYC